MTLPLSVEKRVSPCPCAEVRKKALCFLVNCQSKSLDASTWEIIFSSGVWDAFDEGSRVAKGGPKAHAKARKRSSVPSVRETEKEFLSGHVWLFIIYSV